MGCGFIALAAFVLVVLGLIIFWLPGLNDSAENREAVPTRNVSAYFIVKEDCPTYTKPDIRSDTAGSLEAGKELFIKNINKFIYFYEVIGEDAGKSYVRKKCLGRK